MHDHLERASLNRTEEYSKREPASKSRPLLTHILLGIVIFLQCTQFWYVKNHSNKHVKVDASKSEILDSLHAWKQTFTGFTRAFSDFTVLNPGMKNQRIIEMQNYLNAWKDAYLLNDSFTLHSFSRNETLLDPSSSELDILRGKTIVMLGDSKDRIMLNVLAERLMSNYTCELDLKAKLHLFMFNFCTFHDFDLTVYTVTVSWGVTPYGHVRWLGNLSEIDQRIAPVTDLRARLKVMYGECLRLGEFQTDLVVININEWALSAQEKRRTVEFAGIFQEDPQMEYMYNVGEYIPEKIDERIGREAIKYVEEHMEGFKHTIDVVRELTSHMDTTIMVRTSPLHWKNAKERIHGALINKAQRSVLQKIPDILLFDTESWTSPVPNNFWGDALHPSYNVLTFHYRIYFQILAKKFGGADW